MPDLPPTDDAAERPQIILITPPDVDPASFGDALADVLDRVPVACLRLALATRDEDRLARAADTLREIAHARDVPLVIERHVLLAARLGLDGVHLTDGARGIRAAREELGVDAIVGSFCGTSRHDGMTAAEIGADYVAFGPVAGALGDGRLADPATFAWWSDIIEVPVVAEGGLTRPLIEALWQTTDFFAFGETVWESADPAAALKALFDGL